MQSEMTAVKEMVVVHNKAFEDYDSYISEMKSAGQKDAEKVAESENKVTGLQN